METKTANVKNEIAHFMQGLKKRNSHEPEFHQAVEEVVTSVMPWYLDHEDYRNAQILERLTEPDRIVTFRVSWEEGFLLVCGFHPFWRWAA